MGSIGGGGRYDNLTRAHLVYQAYSGGYHLALTGSYDVMEELKLFPEEIHTGTESLF